MLLEDYEIKRKGCEVEELEGGEIVVCVPESEEDLRTWEEILDELF